MLKIGLTGGIASGKSTVCRLFSQHSIPIIDADIIARQLVAPHQEAYNEILSFFGQQVLQSNGEINRQHLRHLIFSDKVAKQQLETILHPRIRQQLIKQSNAQYSAYCILAIPLLIESDLTTLVDRVLVIDIDATLQLSRLCERDTLSTDDAQRIINSQASRQQRLAHADDVIINNDSRHQLEKLVSDLHLKYLTIAK